MHLADYATVLILTLAMAFPALCQADESGTLYGGVVNGAWGVRPQSQPLQSSGPSMESPSLGHDADRYTPSQLYGGLRLGDGLALEGAQTVFGAMPGDDARRAIGAAVRPGQVPGTLSLAGVGSLPLNDTTSMVAKLGVHYWQADSSAPSLDVSRLASPGVVYGIGIQKQLAKDVQLQAQTERYKNSADSGNIPNVNVMMIGVNVGF
jgi:hypothetical protein